MQRLLKYLNTSSDGFNLALFRILFGVFTFRQTIELQHFVFELETVKFTFPYEHFGFVQPYSHELLLAVVGLAFISSVMIAIGWHMRVFCGLYILSFGYMFLIDQTFYNNHYYLWLLIAFLLAFTQAGKYMSVTNNKNAQIPQWNYTILQVLLLIVYFYAGVAKLRGDWLSGRQMEIHLANQGIHSHALAVFMAWGSTIFDLAIGFVLIWRPKWYVLVVAVLFHLYNFFTFNIGVFPLTMIAALLLYVQPVNFWRKPLGKKEKPLVYEDIIDIKQWRTQLLLLFFGIQAIIPLQRFLLKEDNSWTQQLYMFSWNLIANEWVQKDFKLTVLDPAQDKQFLLDANYYVSLRQIHGIDDNPKLLVELAKKIKAYNKMNDTQAVRAYSLIEFNGYPPALLLNENADLTKCTFSYMGDNPWINARPR